MILAIDNQPGPLPITVNVKAHDLNGGYAMIFGSGHSAQSDTMMSMTLTIGGSEMLTSNIFSNKSGVHRTFVPASVGFELPYEQSTELKLEAPEGTFTDLNDRFSLVLFGNFSVG